MHPDDGKRWQTPDFESEGQYLLSVANQYENSRRLKCFDPRHGIRVTRGGVTVDFVICFQCFQAIV
jgi:hypothetical protein